MAVLIVFPCEGKIYDHIPDHKKPVQVWYKNDTHEVFIEFGRLSEAKKEWTQQGMTFKVYAYRREKSPWVYYEEPEPFKLLKGSDWTERLCKLFH